MPTEQAKRMDEIREAVERRETVSEEYDLDEETLEDLERMQELLSFLDAETARADATEQELVLIRKVIAFEEKWAVKERDAALAKLAEAQRHPSTQLVEALQAKEKAQAEVVRLRERIRKLTQPRDTEFEYFGPDDVTPYGAPEPPP